MSTQELNRPSFFSVTQMLRDRRVHISLGTALSFYFLVRMLEGAPIPLYPYQPMMPTTAMIVTVLAMMGLGWAFREKDWLFYLLVHVFAFGMGATVLCTWQGLPYGPSAFIGDSWFSVSIVERYRHEWLSSDFAYKDLASFYPSLYHFIVAKFAALTGTPSHLAVKYGSYWTAMLLPLGAYFLWRKLLPGALAFVVAVASMYAVQTHFTFKTFEAIPIVLFLPWAMHYVAGFRLKDAPGENLEWEQDYGKWKLTVIGGVTGGLLFMCYYYYFALLLPGGLLLLGISYRSGGQLELKRRLRNLTALAGVILVTASPYWLPLILDFVQYGAVSFQNQWHQRHMADLMFNFTSNWIHLLGFFCLVYLAQTLTIARGLVLYLLCLLIFLGAAHISMYLGTPLLHARLMGMENLPMLIGIVLGIHEISRLRVSQYPSFPHAMMYAFVFVLCMGMGQKYRKEAESDLAQLAMSAQKPLLTAFPEFAKISKDKVLLTDQFSLTAFSDLYLFIVPNAHYNHPSARYRERLKMLLVMSTQKNPDFLAWMLRHNRYDVVDFVCLKDQALFLADDNYPLEPSHIDLKIPFPRQLFKGKYFEQHPDFIELQKVKDVPVELWREFNKAELNLAGMFSDVLGPAETLGKDITDVLKAELDCRVRNYENWKKVFEMRYLSSQVVE